MRPTDPNLLPWRVEEVPFDRIDIARIRDREEMLLLLAAASFVEYASDTYAGNLAEFVDDQPDIAEWLSQRWEPEEMQHGRALRQYVQTVWPSFDWDGAYEAFFDEYRALCGLEGYAASRGLEMAARCIVETGTSTLYKAIRDLADEPVLVKLTEHIRNDEVRHYKHFLQYFDRYNAHERNGRWPAHRRVEEPARRGASQRRRDRLVARVRVAASHRETRRSTLHRDAASHRADGPSALSGRAGDEDDDEAAAAVVVLDIAAAAVADAGGAADPAGAAAMSGRALEAPEAAMPVESTTVVVNGEAIRIDDGCTVADLLARRDLVGKRVAVERNGMIVPRSTHAVTMLSAGDRIEIVVAVGGG